jgi:hypothetical protein
MKRWITLFLICTSLAVLTTGCYTLSAVRFGNKTGSKVRVKSSQTGQEIEVAPGRFKKLPHAAGDLIVTTTVGEKFKFPSIEPPRIDTSDSNYLDKRNGLFGQGYITLGLVLETNMELYALMPGKKSVDSEIPQPKGYPKAGHKLPADQAEADPAHIHAVLERALYDYFHSYNVSAYSGSTVMASDYTVPDSLLPIIRLGQRAMPALRKFSADESSSTYWPAVVCMAIIKGREVRTGEVTIDPRSGLRFTQFSVYSSAKPVAEN